MADTAVKPPETNENTGLKAEIKQLKDTFAAARQAPKPVALHELTKADVDAYRKVRDAIRGALGIEEHPLLRRRALRRLAAARVLSGHEGGEGMLDDEDDEEGMLLEALGGRGKLAMARRAIRRRAMRRLALIRLLAEDEEDDEEGILGQALGRRN
jgi:hypothetical protein